MRIANGILTVILSLFLVMNEAATAFSVDSVIKHLDRLRGRGSNALGFYWLDPHVILFAFWRAYTHVYVMWCSVT